MKQTYQGACHCGHVQFQIDADIDHIRICDCSVCSMRGAFIFRVDAQDVRIETPLDQLSLYRWGSLTAKDYFCPVCGILPFRKPSAPTIAEEAAGVLAFDGWAINTRCLQGFDPEMVQKKPISGSKI